MIALIAITWRGVFTKMRKIYFVIISLCLSLLIICGCTKKDTELKLVGIGAYITMEVPSDWTYCEQDGFIYFVDSQANPVMMETKSFAGIVENAHGELENNPFFSVQNIREISSEVFSNGVIVGKTQVKRNEQLLERPYLAITFIGAPNMLFIVWSDSVDSKLLKRMAKSVINNTPYPVDWYLY